MCGRYLLTAPPSDLSDLLPHPSATLLWPNVPSRWNIAPTQRILAVLREADGDMIARLIRWGLVPHWSRDRGGPPLINARAETLDTKASFRDAARRRRCLIPASGFYEWVSRDGAKHPHVIHLTSGQPFWFAGLWDTWTGPDGPVISTALITVAANRDLAALHHRMPVILPGADAAAVWLDHPAEAARASLVPLPEGLLTIRAVGPLVNSVQTDDPRCLEPPVAPPPTRQGSLF